MRNAGGRTGFVADVHEWAEQQFGCCDLGDVRRTQRLVDYAARQAAQPDSSTNAVCAGDDAVAEGTYRWLRNDAIDPDAVCEGAFKATVEACRGREVMLAIQDTTTLTFQHALAAKLGTVSEVDGHRVGGILVHSTLMVDAQTREPLGLIDQERWSRPTAVQKRRKPQSVTKEYKKRAYEDKESCKWKRSTERMTERLGQASNVVTVCDREADIYEYITYLVDHGQRFVIRAAQDRSLMTPDARLFEVISRQRVIGTRLVEISQRGPQRGTPKQSKREGRPARTATMSIRTATVTLARPGNLHDGPESVQIGIVYLREQNAPEGEDPVEWLLLTGEPLARRVQVEQVIGYYECRWLIEEFHKAWKTGCRLEQRRFQSLANIERFLVVTAPVAVRLLQLRTLTQLRPEQSCSAVLSPAHWQCLAALTQPGRPVPKRAPTVGWAATELAKLGGWRDTKRTGRVGWQAMWQGWSRLEDLVAGWSLAQGL